MNEHEKTIKALMGRDAQLRSAIDQLTYQQKKKNEFTQKSMQHIRVRLTSLKWAIQLFYHNSDVKDSESREQLATIARASSDVVKLVEDLIRTLDDSV